MSIATGVYKPFGKHPKLDEYRQGLAGPTHGGFSLTSNLGQSLPQPLLNKLRTKQPGKSCGSSGVHQGVNIEHHRLLLKNQSLWVTSSCSRMVRTQKPPALSTTTATNWGNNKVNNGVYRNQKKSTHVYVFHCIGRFLLL